MTREDTIARAREKWPEVLAIVSQLLSKDDVFVKKGETPASFLNRTFQRALRMSGMRRTF